MIFIENIPEFMILSVKCRWRRLLRVTELYRVTQRSRVPVTDRTWLQCMCCAPSILQCPNFRGQEYVGIEVWRYGDDAGANTELIWSYQSSEDNTARG